MSEWTEAKERIMRSLPRDCAVVFHCADHGTRAIRGATALDAIYRAAQLCRRGVRAWVVEAAAARGLQACPAAESTEYGVPRAE